MARSTARISVDGEVYYMDMIDSLGDLHVQRCHKCGQIPAHVRGKNKSGMFFVKIECWKCARYVEKVKANATISDERDIWNEALKEWER